MCLDVIMQTPPRVCLWRKSNSCEQLLAVYRDHSQNLFLSVSVFPQALRISHQNREVSLLTVWTRHTKTRKNTRCSHEDYLFFAQPLPPLKPDQCWTPAGPDIPNADCRSFCFICFCLDAQLERVKVHNFRGGRADF